MLGQHSSFSQNLKIYVLYWLGAQEVSIPMTAKRAWPSLLFFSMIWNLSIKKVSQSLCFELYYFSDKAWKLVGWSTIYRCLRFFVMSAREKEFSIHLIEKTVSAILFLSSSVCVWGGGGRGDMSASQFSKETVYQHVTAIGTLTLLTLFSYSRTLSIKWTTDYILWNVFRKRSL